MWDDVKPIVEIVAILLGVIGTGGIVVWWKRVTNKREVDFWREKYNLLKIDIKQLRDEYQELKEIHDKIKILIDASEEMTLKDPNFAKGFLEYIIKHKDK